MGILMSQIIPWALQNIGLIMTTYAADPNNPRFFGYVFRPLGCPTYPLGALLEFLIQLQTYYMVVLYWFLFFAIFSTVTNYWIRAIARFVPDFLPKLLLSFTVKQDVSWTILSREGKSCSDFRIAASPKQREVSLKTYRELKVLNALYNSCLSCLAWPSFILCNLSCHCLCIYIAVKLFDQVNIYIAMLFSTWAVVFLVLDFVIFPHMGQSKELSMEYLRRLAGQGKRSKLDQATLKSLRPIEIKASFLFTMDRSTVLTVIVLVSNLTVNTLLLV